MTEQVSGRTTQLFGRSVTFLRKCLLKLISVGPIPDHIAFIMDGNRRYAKKHHAAEGAGHKAGFSSLMSMLRHCYELGVKYVTVYAFSIDNFKRGPEEVQYLMDLMLEKIEGLLQQESIVNQYGIRVYFIGNLKLLNDPVRLAAEKAMKATANNNKATLLVCVAYTSCDEIVHAVQQSCNYARNQIQMLHGSKGSSGASEGVEEDNKSNNLINRDFQESCEDNSDYFASRSRTGLVEEDEACEKQSKLPAIKLVDIEKHMHMSVAPDPDIVIRSSGETRLSNFLLWQTANCVLYSPAALWPELGLRHLVWAVLKFQRSYQYLEKKRKKM